MNEYLRIESPELLFLADTHFRDRRNPREETRRERFADFLRSVAVGSHVFLLGDIFDFYFGYGSVVSKRYFDVFTTLHEASRRGVELHFVGGNHDYWVDDFLHDEIGLTLHGEWVLVECQGRRICCTHGDQELPGDRGYKVLRTLIRNPYVIKAAKMIHPDLMDRIARSVSKETRKRHRLTQEETANSVADFGAESCFAHNNDIFIMGHVHHPLHRNRNGRDFLILGDWIENFTYGRLKDGKVTLEKLKTSEPG